MNSLGSAILAGLSLVTPAAAANVNLGPLAWIGNPGNAGDPVYHFGGVAADYQIMTREVTNGQYAEFLNQVATTTDLHGLYNTSMGSDARGGITRNGNPGAYSYTPVANMADKPVNFVSMDDAVRFANWINNGQGNSTTESGSYTIGEQTITRSSGAVRIPTLNEWYKAAYYNAATGLYSLYPTNSNAPQTEATVNLTGVISNPGSNIANFNSGADWNALDGNLTSVASAGLSSRSCYGTYDQGGNVAEWNFKEVLGTYYVVKGGSFQDADTVMGKTAYQMALRTDESDHIGFRLAIPEPSCLMLTILAGGVLWTRRKRS